MSEDEVKKKKKRNDAVKTSENNEGNIIGLTCTKDQKINLPKNKVTCKEGSIGIMLFHWSCISNLVLIQRIQC